MRWELHRVWVVEATLKPGKRHIYHTRRFYIDEDSWVALAADMCDAHGDLYKVDYSWVSQNYDLMNPLSLNFVVYNLTSHIYVVAYTAGKDGYMREGKLHSERWWISDMMASQGIR